jgi:hypothetical protein
VTISIGAVFPVSVGCVWSAQFLSEGLCSCYVGLVIRIYFDVFEIGQTRDAFLFFFWFTFGKFGKKKFI